MWSPSKSAHGLRQLRAVDLTKMVAIYLIVILSLLLLLQLNAAARRIAIVGSGNWGSAAARRVALNILDRSEADAHEKYNSTVTMWVYEEQVRMILLLRNTCLHLRIQSI